MTARTVARRVASAGTLVVLAFAGCSPAPAVDAAPGPLTTISCSCSTVSGMVTVPTDTARSAPSVSSRVTVNDL